MAFHREREDYRHHLHGLISARARLVLELASHRAPRHMVTMCWEVWTDMLGNIGENVDRNPLTAMKKLVVFFCDSGLLPASKQRRSNISHAIANATD
mmetsp:Transcript_92708/g.145552  ORF Transcript_92708/g.145552 Transcript_92708/m.145552 type:complete len:97 (-) Transcript_92708:75-365(-)